MFPGDIDVVYRDLLLKVRSTPTPLTKGPEGSNSEPQTEGESQTEKATFEKWNLRPNEESRKDCNPGKLRRRVQREEQARDSHTNSKAFFNTSEAGSLLVSLCG